MILWSVIEPQLVWQNVEKCPEMQYWQQGNAILAVRAQGRSYSVERLISTDPRDYLKKEMTPGSSIRER